MRWAWRAYLVDQLKTVLVLRALVGEFNARRREGRGGGQNNRGGGEEGHSLKRAKQRTDRAANDRSVIWMRC